MQTILLGWWLVIPLEIALMTAAAVGLSTWGFCLLIVFLDDDTRTTEKHYLRFWQMCRKINYNFNHYY
ncbi:hypothetical protein BDN71DRAFT_1057642 [Pleurotus eryngii]|uniref:Uncharacterized protein n=1 Tax=Pleurotus eryngii TaxID=5323 RepID=A0A9P6DE86_PLEER|nr:hypothetical protein BDN71DRAFT_1057642 [Pleurotus eryngii]